MIGLPFCSSSAARFFLSHFSSDSFLFLTQCNPCPAPSPLLPPLLTFSVCPRSKPQTPSLLFPPHSRSQADRDSLLSLIQSHNTLPPPHSSASLPPPFSPRSPAPSGGASVRTSLSSLPMASGYGFRVQVCVTKLWGSGVVHGT